MAIISDRDRGIIRNRFDKELVDEVGLEFFTQRESPLAVPEQQGPSCREEHQLLEEVAALSTKLRLTVHDFVDEVDRPAVERFQIAEIPALVISNNGGKGVRFFGLPSGYEFATLIEDIVDVSRGQTGLSNKTQEALRQLREPLHVRVFVTPT